MHWLDEIEMWVSSVFDVRRVFCLDREVCLGDLVANAPLEARDLGSGAGNI